MAITAAERRFLRSWEEQRRDGKKAYVATYTFGLTFLIFLCFVALGLFLSVPFIKATWLIIIGISSVVLAFLIAMMAWSMHQKKWRQIILREMEQAN